MFGYAFHCVTRGLRAVGHAVWLSFQEQGYIMATGMLPSDETEDLVNPESEEYTKHVS